MYYLIFYLARFVYYLYLNPDSQTLFEIDSTISSIDLFLLFSASLFALSIKRKGSELQKLRIGIIYTPIYVVFIFTIIGLYMHFIANITQSHTEIIHNALDALFVFTSVAYSLLLPFDYFLKTKKDKSSSIKAFLIMFLSYILARNSSNTVFQSILYSLPFIYMSYVLIKNNETKHNHN